MSKGRRVGTLLLGGAIVGGLLIASGAIELQIDWRDNVADAIDLFGRDKPGAGTAAAQPFWQEGEQTPPPPAAFGQFSFADLAQRVSPAVVNIQTSKTVSGHPLRVPPPFEPFFGGPFEEFFGGRREFKVPSLGSGFVIASEGFIVTNNHVIEEVDKIKVAFRDGTEYEAEVVGRDPATDVALIRVEPEGELLQLPLGDSDELRPGDWVVAIGNPFGLEHTVTAGIVSALHRRNIGAGRYEDFIQTDAAINPGNSGGPLLNLAGEVVGINTAINPRANTIGFAVPVNMAKEILPQLREVGHVTRGWLGVVIQRITPDLQEHFDLESRQGALVSKVDPRGPAADAGIQRGDVIVGFEGQKVEEMEDLPRLVAAVRPGTKVEVTVLREGKEKAFGLALGELEEPERVASRPKEEEGPAAFGLRVQNLTPEVAEQLGVEEDRGVVITSIKPDGPADEAGLRRGDVILEVDQEAVQDVSDLRSRLQDKEKALLLVRRGDNTVFIALKRESG